MSKTSFPGPKDVHFSKIRLHFAIYIIYLCFVISASATVVPCLTTLVSMYGGDDQKGTIMGVFRSLGALARALGPVMASTGNFI